jgi:transposase
MRRCIGLDVHREFAQVAIWEDSVVRQAGRIQTTPEALREFAGSLCLRDEVALEATGNTYAIARLLEQHVGRVVVSNPQKTRAIAEAKVKTDKVDAAPAAVIARSGQIWPSRSIAASIGHRGRRAGHGWPGSAP